MKKCNTRSELAMDDKEKKTYLKLQKIFQDLRKVLGEQLDEIDLLGNWSSNGSKCIAHYLDLINWFI